MVPMDCLKAAYPFPTSLLPLLFSGRFRRPKRRLLADQYEWVTLFREFIWTVLAVVFEVQWEMAGGCAQP